MATRWFEQHLVPLASAVSDYEVRKIRALQRADAVSASAVKQQPARRRGNRFGHELAMSMSDGRIRGQIDAVLPGVGGAVLQDYKTGAVLDEVAFAVGATRVKEEYSIQLKLYAALYRDVVGAWPSRLEIIPPSGAPIAVDYTTVECEQLVRNALEHLGSVNSIIELDASDREREDRLATPDPETCAHCLYRPACRSYRAARATRPNEIWPADGWGQPTEIRTLGNGRRMLALAGAAGPIPIRGLDPAPARHPALDRAGARVMSAFNLRRTGPSAFREGAYTTIYAEREVTERLVGT